MISGRSPGAPRSTCRRRGRPSPRGGAAGCWCGAVNLAGAWRDRGVQGARWAGCRWYGSGCGSQSGDLGPDAKRSGELSARLFRYFGWRCWTEGTISRCATWYLLNPWVTMTRGTYYRPLRSLRKNFLAANAFRRGWTRMSSRCRAGRPRATGSGSCRGPRHDRHLRDDPAAVRQVRTRLRGRPSPPPTPTPATSGTSTRYL